MSLTRDYVFSKPWFICKNRMIHPGNAVAFLDFGTKFLLQVAIA